MGLNNLGAVQDERGNYDAAIPIFELALSIDPTLEVARNNLAWAKAHRGEQRK
jgi:tetratricopeptide (TPR) repeat protein